MTDKNKLNSLIYQFQLHFFDFWRPWISDARIGVHNVSIENSSLSVRVWFWNLMEEVTHVVTLNHELKFQYK